MKQSKAGWATIEITPPLGLAMGGRGARFSPGETVLDPLFGQVTVLEDSRGRRLVVVSLDLIGVGPELAGDIQSALSRVTGAPPASVLVNCSHTHSGPMTHWSKMASLEVKPAALMEYEQELVFRIQKAAGDAMGRLRPAEISWQEGTCDVGINRRRLVDGKATNISPNPDGAYNRELTVIQLKTDQGRAVIFSHGCHPVIVYGFNWTGISAEWPGRARGFIRESLGEQTHVQFLQGLAGDVRPRVFADLEAGVFRKSRPEDVDAAGRTMAEAVIKTLDQDAGEALELKVGSVSGVAMLRSEPGDPLEVWQAQVDDPDELTRNNARYWARRLAEGSAPNTHIPWSVGLAQLTDAHRLAWIAGEPLSPWMEVLRETAGARHLMALGYTGGIQGYLPRDQQLPEGGYEITRSRKMGYDGPGHFKPGLDQAVREAFQRLARAIGQA
jgi:hypothetical protein